MTFKWCSFLCLFLPVLIGYYCRNQTGVRSPKGEIKMDTTTKPNFKIGETVNATLKEQIIIRGNEKLEKGSKVTGQYMGTHWFKITHSYKSPVLIRTTVIDFV